LKRKKNLSICLFTTFLYWQPLLKQFKRFLFHLRKKNKKRKIRLLTIICVEPCLFNSLFYIVTVIYFQKNNLMMIYYPSLNKRKKYLQPTLHTWARCCDGFFSSLFFNTLKKIIRFNFFSVLI
jgi:Na+/melibiose symporter-like transporter